MPGRTHPLVTDYVYHVYKKSIEKKIIFVGRFCEIFLNTAFYYRSSHSLLRYSNFKKLTPTLLESYKNKVTDRSSFRGSILAYCLMPTHFHLLIKQNKNKGISIFMSQLQNSFTRFYNSKKQRTGPLFLDKFKSKLILSDDLLKHVSRYIHLNPYSGGALKKTDALARYPYSSFVEYLSMNENSLCDSQVILSLFDGDRKRYEDFVINNAEYQKTLEYCKYSNKWQGPSEQ